MALLEEPLSLLPKYNLSLILEVHVNEVRFVLV